MATTGELPEPAPDRDPEPRGPASGAGSGGALPILLAVPEPAIEAELLAGLGRPGAGVTVVRRCVDLADLLGAASTGTSVAAVVSASLRRFDQDALTRLRRAGVAVVGLLGSAADASTANAAEVRLRQIGLEHVVVGPRTSEARDGLVPAVVQTVRAAVAAGALRSDGTSAVRRGPVEGPTSLVPNRPSSGSLELPASEPAAVDRRLVAVWGPTGAPGRSLLAWQLAGEYAAAGYSTMLIDADVYGGTIAQLAGLVDEAPGVVAACRAANAGALDAARLAALARAVPLPSVGAAPLSVLTGIGHASRWPEVRPAALESVLASARLLADRVVVDCGFSLEDDEELSYDTTAPRRNAATLTALATADELLVVGSAEPVGLIRLIAGLDDLRTALEVADAAPELRVLVNRVRDSGRQRRDVTTALERHAGVTPVALLPLDQPAADRAADEGRLLLEVGPRSPLRLAIAGLASGERQPAGGRATAAARRRRRLLPRAG